MKISVERYHYPIGQGTFSAQIIRGLGDSKYVCVYDCGSVSGADGIPVYVDGLCKKLNPNSKDKAKIDLLVISHLDRDHVNGVSKLIESFDVKKIVIPYMSKIEKIMLALDSPSGRRMLEGRDPLTPRSSLVNAINRAGDYDIQFLEEELGDVEIVESSRDISTEYFDINKDTSKVKRWPYKLWEFLHFSLYAGEEESVKDGFVEEFKNSYRVEFGRNCKDLNKMTASDLSNDWIKLKKVYAKTCERMKEAHGVNCKDIFNSSSVILYSGPADNLTGSGENYCRVHRVSKGRQIIVDYKNLDEHYRESFYYRIENDNSKYIGGWLGTGDARLKDPLNIDELRVNLGQERINRIRVLTVPHHGSENNSNDKFYNIFSRTRVECVVHSDPGYTFHHPHTEIEELIAKKGLVEVPVTKEPESCYKERLLYRYW
ncbi:hypothetical protein [Rothia sp. HMSC062F03]|uniref:hypothetical protein n=1 Tax=Rothia sp. HMSC062F03 TaxID=1715153 RepID=UPI000AAB5996|nr:hypothetical protein [Rothia sp. HMSC062F03]